MNISKVNISLAGEDIVSIFNEFVDVQGLAIEKVEIHDEIVIQASFKKGINFTFQANLKLSNVEDGIISAELTKFKVLNIGIVSVVRKLAIKYALKAFKDKGITYNKGKVEIEYKYLLKDVPYIDFNIESIYCYDGFITVEVEQVQVSIQGLIKKDVKLKVREEEQEKEANEVDYDSIEKTNDIYTEGRDKLAEKLPTKVKKYTDYIFIIPDLIALIVRLMKDKRVSTKTKLIVCGAMAYIAVPTDFIPDKIPFVGKIDDLAIIFFSLNKIINDVPTEVILENWQGKNDIVTVFKTLIEYITEFTGAKNVETIYNVIEEIATL